jgi:phosphatidylglycerophosphate synthase
VLARDAAQTSAFGGYLDITLDMAGYAAMVVGFAVAHPALWLAWLAVLAGYVVVITTTLALSDAARRSGRHVSLTNRTFLFTPALTEAGETSVMYGVWVVFPQQLPWLVWVWVAALAITTVQRTVLAWRLLR